MARIALCVAVLATAVAGQTVLYQSLPNDWSHVWGTPYWTDNVTTGESSYGVVDQLNMVWWLEWFSPNVNLPAGEYGVRVRLKKLTNASGRYDLTLSQNGAGNAVTLSAALQTVDSWVWTPDLTFTVGPGGSTEAFRLHNTSGNLKENYWFDMFEVRQPDFQTNQPEATSDVDGVTTNGFDPAVAESCTGGTAMLNFSSTEVNQPWDFGYAFAPALGGSVTGLALGSGQVVNVNVADPTFQYFNGGGFTTPFTGNFSLPVTVPAAGVASMQSAHVAPAHPDGIALSQASQLDIVQSGSPAPLALGDDVVQLVQFSQPPYCGGMNSITFYGTSYTYFWVNSNGEVQFGFPSPSPNVSLQQFKTWMPRVSAMWTDLSPTQGGQVDVTATATDVKVSWSNVSSSGLMNTANTVDVTFTAAGATIIDNYAPDPGHLFSTLVGITRGGGSTDPGPMGGTVTGTILGNLGGGAQSGLATDCIYETTSSSAPAAGWTSLTFPNSDGSAWIVN